MYGKSTANQLKITPTNFSYCAWLHICSWLLAWQELKRVRYSWITQLQLVFSYLVYKKFCLHAVRLDASNRTVFFFRAVSLFFFFRNVVFLAQAEYSYFLPILG